MDFDVAFVSLFGCFKGSNPTMGNWSARTGFFIQKNKDPANGSEENFFFEPSQGFYVFDWNKKENMG
jgi:hypothetical protein